MSNALTDLRVQLKTLLTDAGVNAFVIAPTTATPPMVYVGPGDPYVTREGAAFGSEIVRHDLGIVAPPGVNEVIAERLDELVLTVLDVIDPSEDFIVDPLRSVDRPGQITLNGQRYVATTITVLTEIHR
jgi:hypothetical protein